MGCDFRENGIQGFVCKFQSTHPRGVRLTRLRRPCFRRYFNPRTHVGCDNAPKFTFDEINDFNPRTHVGCDVIRRQFGLEFLRISIHAPTWGATRPFYRPCRCCGISIHAPTWGATGLRHNGLQPARISIHAPTWGATKVNPDVNVMHLFQSTHPRGVRHGEDVVMERIDRISIHAPTWGAT